MKAPDCLDKATLGGGIRGAILCTPTMPLSPANAPPYAPAGFDGELWEDLSDSERFYIMGIEYEKGGEKGGGCQASIYKEIAREYAVSGYARLVVPIGDGACRLRTPAELALRKLPSPPGFEVSLLRLVLAAIYVAVKKGGKPDEGLRHIAKALPDSSGCVDMALHLLRYLGGASGAAGMQHWNEASKMAERIADLAYSGTSNAIQM